MMILRGFGVLSILVLLVSCQTGPTVLEEDSTAVQEIFHKPSASEQDNTQTKEHRVLVLDTLGGSRYSYLKVREGDTEFWLATLKAGYKLQEEYIFSNGIYKTDYYSTAFNRSFDEIYLVSDLRPAYSSGQKQALEQIFKTEAVSDLAEERNLGLIEGGVSIKELISNAEKYLDQEVLLTAEVVKINANIMDRHWLHLKDGSYDEFDLVATSQTAVPAGHVVNLKARLRKSVDFGAGYSYDLLLENAEVLP